jgi:hypothetical protein
MKLRSLPLILLSALSLSGCEQGEGTGYDLPDLVLDLRREDALVLVGASASQPFFSVPATALKVDGQDVRAFEYVSGAVAAAEIQTVSSDGGIIASKAVSWTGTPHFYRRDRIIALYLGNDAETTGLLTSVLGAQVAGR